jgi:hypothetical protein
MKRSLLLGVGRHMLPVPGPLWRRQMRQSAEHSSAGLGFMTETHRRVHHCVVRELPRCGQPLTPEFIAGQLALPVDQVIPILDDLETHMTFLFRNPQGAVIWAYPVTVEKTPHRITFSSGEQIYAA